MSRSLDEREIAVGNAGHRLGHNVALYLILIDIALRSLLKGQAPWDLFAIVIGSSLVVMAYQARSRALTPGWVKWGLVALAVAVVVAGVVALILWGAQQGGAT